MEFVQGGELFSHLRGVLKFEEPKGRFYAAQVANIFE